MSLHLQTVVPCFITTTFQLFCWEFVTQLPVYCCIHWFTWQEMIHPYSKTHFCVKKKNNKQIVSNFHHRVCYPEQMDPPCHTSSSEMKLSNLQAVCYNHLQERTCQRKKFSIIVFVWHGGMQKEHLESSQINGEFSTGI